MNLDKFTQAYIQAMLWSTNDNSDESGGIPLDENYSFMDLSPEALTRIVDDCNKFQAENADDISRHPHTVRCHTDSYGRDEYSGLECAGHDFWLTRNHHGVGFWDRDWLDQEVKDRLTAACHKFGECWVEVGDDGLLYIL